VEGERSKGGTEGETQRKAARAMRGKVGMDDNR
jgi:hypothetical protein